MKRANGNRAHLVEKFFHHDKFDVGFTVITKQGVLHEVYRKDRMSLSEQLKCKVLLNIEGNDVASGLHWMLNSSSVVMMPKRYSDSWLMESTLVPNEHFIPVNDDFSDLEDQFEWAMTHEKECLEIIENANNYMKKFLDWKNEILIEREVFKRYLENMNIY